MSILLKPSTILLWLPLLAHVVASDFPFIRKPHVPDVMISMQKIQQVKDRILRGLNMTAAPRLLTRGTSRVKVRSPMQDAERKPNVSMILSEASYEDRSDTLSFKLNSQVRAQIQDIEVAVLIAVLRSNGDTRKRNAWMREDSTKHIKNLLNRRPSNKQRRVKRKRLQASTYAVDEADSNVQCYHNSTASVATNSSSDVTMQSSSRASGQQLTDRNNSSCRTPGLQDRRQRRSRQLYGLKSWPVKVVIKAIDPETGKRRRIAVEKVMVRKSSTMVAHLSKDIILAAAASSNHTLQLQMTCKRCRGRVHIEKVYKTLRRKNKQLQTKRRLNPHRPYLFIKAGSHVMSSDHRNSQPTEAKTDSPNGIAKTDSPNGIAKKRDKRRIVANSLPRFDVFLNSTPRHALFSDVSCCSENIQVTFKELGIDFVLHPYNVSLYYCIFSCQHEHSNKSQLHISKRGYFNKQSLNSTSQTRNCNLEMINTTPAPNSRRSFYELENKSFTAEEKMEEEAAMFGIRRLQQHRGCVMVIVQPAPVIYLHGHRSVRSGHLDHITYQSCHCPGRR